MKTNVNMLPSNREEIVPQRRMDGLYTMESKPGMFG